MKGEIDNISEKRNQLVKSATLNKGDLDKCEEELKKLKTIELGLEEVDEDEEDDD